MKDLTYEAWENTMDAKELIEAQDENRSKSPAELEADSRQFLIDHFVFMQIG